MYTKKFTYSLFTMPFFLFTNHMADWQRRRYNEKVNEKNTRIERIVEDPVNIQNFYNKNEVNKFPWIGLDSTKLNEKFAWKPIELSGQFDHSREVLVAKNREGEEGYDVITPFYCYKDETGKLQPILVNRGWIPEDKKNHTEHWVNSTGPITIKGLVYKGDESHKYSKPNDIAANKFYTLKPEEIAVQMMLKNREISSQFVIKQLEFNPINRSNYPRVLNIQDLGNFPIPEQLNNQYHYFWNTLSFMNVFSNIMLWIYL